MTHPVDALVELFQAALDDLEAGRVEAAAKVLAKAEALCAPESELPATLPASRVAAYEEAVRLQAQCRQRVVELERSARSQLGELGLQARARRAYGRGGPGA